MPYAQLIVNPIAGAGKTAKNLSTIYEILNSLKFDYSSTKTEYPGHAIELAQLAVKNGVKMIVSVGGDGTVNEVVNGINNAGGLGEVTLGIISTGTGADYIRTLGIPRTIEQACQKLLEKSVSTVDLGQVTCIVNGQKKNRIFVNFAGLGFDAEIVRTTTQKYKSLGKVSAYLLALFATLSSYENKNITMEINSNVENHKICTVIMGNGRYGGGGMLTTPEADIRDKLLDVLIVGDLSKPDLIKSLPRIYKGTHLSHPKVKLKRASEVIINSEDIMAIQADGELIGSTPATFKIFPIGLNVII